MISSCERKKNLVVGVVKLSAMGDVIWTIPLVRSLMQHFPQWNIVWIVDEFYAPLLRRSIQCKIASVKRPKGLRSYFQIRKKLKHYHFDLLLCAQTSLRINLLYPFIRAKNKWGLNPERHRDGHALFVHAICKGIGGR